MKRYQVQTGDYKTEEVAPSLEGAVIAAFCRSAPKEPSLLTRARARGEPWQYIATDVMLKKAGYKVHT